MKLIYPMLTTVSLLLTASPSFGLSSEEIASLGVDPGVFTLVVNAIACLGIVSLVPNTIAMGMAIRKAMEFGRFWEKFKFMLYTSLFFPVAIILTTTATGLIIGWTDLLGIAIGLNVVFIVVSVPYMAIVFND